MISLIKFKRNQKINDFPLLNQLENSIKMVYYADYSNKVISLCDERHMIKYSWFTVSKDGPALRVSEDKSHILNMKCLGHKIAYI